jgi:hypothetical protein
LRPADVDAREQAVPRRIDQGGALIAGPQAEAIRLLEVARRSL